MNNPSSSSRDQTPPYSGYYIQPPPPEDPPPSYDDATRSSNAPLLVGPPPDYGTAYRAYPEPDTSSTASSDIERTNRSLPEWVGQALVVFCFVAIIYGFFSLANDIVYTLGAGLGDMLYDMYKLDATAQFRYKNKKWKA